ncbi:hypothetical protein GM921_00535 [Pedobacter sp. LMG 31464]|uniref:KAP NTPase domain-containing protein n=1 Tax=Pedobacter planticolens TaxID=2679964 RepID=A0A923ITP1_9SPHI|nr:P-loop NTPase fold protein [Pedobacter planticolens]MBB2143956.1 hypothetical protein [Pedobacter planticolens]
MQKQSPEQQESSNEHIKTYLIRFEQMPVAPGYAMLLRGNWGSGKSWFIKDYMKENPENYIYISLYGISSFREIEDAFFVQLHPLLGSKGMKFAGKFLTTVLKATLKIDLNGDGKEDLEVAGKIPSLDVESMAKKLDGRTIIFDDLERCSVELQSLLGYINQLVENMDMKVVVIANEVELIKLNLEDPNSKIRYTSVKEKLIGKSFDLKADYLSAFKCFCNEIDYSNASKILSDNQELIRGIFESAKYGNLRHLRQSVLEFVHFYEFLPKNKLQKPGLLTHILELFFSISFEVRMGKIQEDQLHKIFLIDFQVSSSTKEKEPCQEIRDKYPVFRNYNHPLDTNQLIAFFRYGLADKQLLEKSVKNSVYFLDENTPDWVKLYYFQTIEEKDFNLLRVHITNSLKNKTIDHLEILMHVVGNLCNLSNLDIIPIKISAIIKLGTACLKNIIANTSVNTLSYFSGSHSLGLSYQGLMIKEVNDFQQLILQSIIEKKGEVRPKLAQELMDLMQTNLQLFVQQVTVTNFSQSVYYDTPIFIHIEPQKFSDLIWQTSNAARVEIGEAFSRRYIHQFKAQLLPELEWLIKVKELLAKKIIPLKKGLLRHNLKYFVNTHLTEAISCLSY